jgi:hypothetical protein
VNGNSCVDKKRFRHSNALAGADTCDAISEAFDVECGEQNAFPVSKSREPRCW